VGSIIWESKKHVNLSRYKTGFQKEYLHHLLIYSMEEIKKIEKQRTFSLTNYKNMVNMKI